MVVTDKGEETRRRIIEAASGVFAEHGYAGASLNDIIRASGLTKGGFYFHFESKARLAVAVIEALRADWRAHVLAASAPHERAIDRLEAIVWALQELKQTHPGSGAIDRLCSELEDDAEVGGDIEPFQGWFELVEGIVKEAQEQGDVDRSIDPGAAARFCVCSFIGVDHVSRLRRAGALVVGTEDYLAFVMRALGVER